MKASSLILWVLATMLFTSCEQDQYFSNLSEGKSAASTSPCAIEYTRQPLKILFMVDHSGSTAKTDPGLIQRVATVETFLASYGAQPNLSYSYGYFGTNPFLFDIRSGAFIQNSAPIPFGNAVDEAAALAKFKTLATAGGTNYKIALNSVSALIKADSMAGNKDSYVVIFMSDGQPTDLGNTAALQLSGAQNAVNTLRNTVGKERLTLSTVFFGNNSDLNSINNLSGMAATGGGLFVNTNITKNLSIDSIINVPVQVCN